MLVGLLSTAAGSTDCALAVPAVTFIAPTYVYLKVQPPAAAGSSACLSSHAQYGGSLVYTVHGQTSSQDIPQTLSTATSIFVDELTPDTE